MPHPYYKSLIILFQNKTVTIVHANRLLLGDMYPDNFRQDIESRIRLRGVNILFNDTIEGMPNPHAPLKTGKGVPLPCDLLVLARGGRPNTSLLKFLRPDVLSDRGYIRVRPTLQIDRHPNMFALGDVIDWPEAKQLMKISMGHTAVVITNVMSYLEGKVPKKTYTKSPEFLSISNGRVCFANSMFALELADSFVDWRCFLLGFVMGSFLWKLLHKICQVKRPDGRFCTQGVGPGSRIREGLKIHHHFRLALRAMDTCYDRIRTSDETLNAFVVAIVYIVYST